MQSEKTLKVGVIGVGVMGAEHARVYSNLRNSQLIGIYDRDKKLAREISGRLNCQSFLSVEKLLAQVQAVSVCTPTTTHFEIAQLSLESGVATLVEKPLSNTLSEAEALLKIARKKKVVLTVGHIERFNPIIDALKKRIEGERVISINITRVGPVPPRIKDVGIILDLGTHDIDLIRYLSGSEVEQVHSVSTSKTNKFEDAAILSFKMTNNTIASIINNWYTPYKVRQIEIATMDKLLVGNFMSQQVIEFSDYDGAGSYLTKHLPIKYTEPLFAQLKHFTDAVLNKKKPKVSGEDGLEAVRVALQCLES